MSSAECLLPASTQIGRLLMYLEPLYGHVPENLGTIESVKLHVMLAVRDNDSWQSVTRQWNSLMDDGTRHLRSLKISQLSFSLRCSALKPGVSIV